MAGSSGELADDTNESSVLVFQPLVIGTQIDKDLWREGGGNRSWCGGYFIDYNEKTFG